MGFPSTPQRRHNQGPSIFSAPIAISRCIVRLSIRFPFIAGVEGGGGAAELVLACGLMILLLLLLAAGTTTFFADDGATREREAVATFPPRTPCMMDCCLDAINALPTGVVFVLTGFGAGVFVTGPDVVSARTVNDVPEAPGVFCVIFSLMFLLLFNRCGYFFITSLMILAWSIFWPGVSCIVTVAVVVLLLEPAGEEASNEARADLLALLPADVDKSDID